MIQYIISHSFKYFQDGEIDLKLLTNVLSPETEVFEVTIMYFAYLEIDFEINISDKKSRRFDLSEVIFKCIKVL